jgi:hypothetical protein
MFNPPPANLKDLSPLIFKAAKGSIWFRSHRPIHSPIFFGTTKTQRWDSPDAAYGVLYLGLDEHCAFMESIGRGVLKTRFVPSSELRQRGLSTIRFAQDLSLVDMADSGGLTRLGAEGSLTSGQGYKNPQRWSQALRSHGCNPHGIRYRSRHDPARLACALFDHCKPLLEIAAAFVAWADHPKLAEILDHYDLGTDL